MPITAIFKDCPNCEERTVHNRVRPADGVGIRALCRRCTDVVDGLENGRYRLAK